MLQVHKATLSELRDELSGEVTLSRFDLLANLAREDGQTIASLSRRMLVTAGNLTGLVDRAERDGLVERHADPGDRRATRIQLTRRGLKLYDEALARHARRLERLFRVLGARDLDTLNQLLDKLRRSLPERARTRARSR
jgi:DNA-binding MarR family transcriptional regulator